MFRRTFGTGFVGAAALGALLVVFANRAEPAQALANCDASTAEVSPVEQQMLELMNAERVRVGAPALKFSPNLNRTAAWKATDSTSSGPTFSHTDSLGRSFFVRVAECGYPYGAGENLAYGSTSAAGTFNQWMTSPLGHREVMLNPRWRVVGIGNVGFRWAANFGSVDDSGQTSPPPSPSATQPGSGGTASTPTSPPTKTPVPPTPARTPTPAPTALPRVGVNVALSAGENLVTYTGPEQPIMLALDTLRGQIIEVYEWRVDEQRWAKYAPGVPAYANSFTTLKPNGVYVIELSGGGNWLY